MRRRLLVLLVDVMMAAIMIVGAAPTGASQWNKWNNCWGSWSWWWGRYTKCVPSNDWWIPYWGDTDDGDTVVNYGDGRYDEDDEDDGRVDHLLLTI